MEYRSAVYTLLTILLLPACTTLVTPDAKTVEPAARTARLEELYRLASLKGQHRGAADLADLILRVVPDADEVVELGHVSRWIVDSAIENDLDPLLVAALIGVESYFRPTAISSAGAVGLMQVLPYVGRDVAERRGILWQGWRTLEDPRRNIRVGAAYFGELVDAFDSVPLALAAYNMGPTLLASRLRRGWRPDGPYVRKVLDLYRRLRAEQMRDRAWAQATLTG